MSSQRIRSVRGWAIAGCVAAGLVGLASNDFDVPLVRAAEPAAGPQYHGIVLPAVWPPRRADYPDQPQPPPYLADPPAVIPIDVGRQLLVDDFLIAETTLKRTFHLPVYHPGNPVLKPDRS